MSKNRTTNIGTKQVTVTATCTVTKQPYSVTVPLGPYNKWIRGAMIQDAMSFLTANQREFLVSGLTPAEGDKIFGPEE